MKRFIAIAATGIVLTGCGGSGTSATAQCVKFKAAAQSWAQNYVSDLPSSVSQGTVQQLAASHYKVAALSHGINCR